MLLEAIRQDLEARVFKARPGYGQDEMAYSAVGQWTTAGEIKASPFSPEGKLIGTDTYEWLPGGFSLFTAWMCEWATKGLSRLK